jgi:hypothetical protein
MDGAPFNGMCVVYCHGKRILELRVMEGILHLRDADGWQRVNL